MHSRCLYSGQETEESRQSEPVIARTPDTELFSPDHGNRHGLITGATGTGKTVTLQNWQSHCRKSWRAVFMADVKGDLTGIAQAGTASEKLLTRLKKYRRYRLATESGGGVGYLWEKGHPVRTVSDWAAVAGAAVES